MKTASSLSYGEFGIITNIDHSHPSARRIIEVGFTPGQQIQLVSSTAFNDPIAFSLRGSVIAIRKSEANSIFVQ